MKVSIITVVYNNKDTIKQAIESVLLQDYSYIEHIVIDGNSTDGTVEIIKSYEHKISKWISEPDNGIYDAMNKGIKLATGEIIGFLNSDDFYANDSVVETVVNTMEEKCIDSCYGDLVYVDRGNPEKVLRYWRSRHFKENKFKRGWMPPHPTFFVKKWVYDTYGAFNLHFPIAADYELMLRFLHKYRISVAYIPEVLVRMRIGGKSNSSLKNIIRANVGCYCAWKTNDLVPPTPLIFVLKPASKVLQYLCRG